jgi:hypothetical protein
LSGSGRLPLSSNDSSFNGEPSRLEAARQTGTSVDRLSGSKRVNMSRFRWKARPRLWLRYESRMRRVRHRHVGRKLPPPNEARIST